MEQHNYQTGGETCLKPGLCSAFDTDTPNSRSYVLWAHFVCISVRLLEACEPSVAVPPEGVAAALSSDATVASRQKPQSDIQKCWEWSTLSVSPISRTSEKNSPSTCGEVSGPPPSAALPPFLPLSSQIFYQHLPRRRHVCCFCFF